MKIMIKKKYRKLRIENIIFSELYYIFSLFSMRKVKIRILYTKIQLMA